MSYTQSQTYKVLSLSSAAGGALTATISNATNVDSSQRIYISAIEITRASAAAVVGSAVLNITTAGFTSALGWNVGNAIAAGQTISDVHLQFPAALCSKTQSDVVFNLPAAGTGVVWNINIYYNLY